MMLIGWPGQCQKKKSTKCFVESRIGGWGVFRFYSCSLNPHTSATVPQFQPKMRVKKYERRLQDEIPCSTSALMLMVLSRSSSFSYIIPRDDFLSSFRLGLTLTSRRLARSMPAPLIPPTPTPALVIMFLQFNPTSPLPKKKKIGRFSVSRRPKIASRSCTLQTSTLFPYLQLHFSTKSRRPLFLH
uniref:Os07g0563300 protein n=1 Tax=Fopius arisanus TaxID=64838 RepID=A0A0C9QI36_9HYME